MEQRPVRFGQWLIACAVLGGLVAFKVLEPGGSQSAATPEPKPTSAPTSVMFGSPPAPTLAPTPDPDQAAGMLSRFYRDLDKAGSSSTNDLASILTPAFDRIHAHDWVADYGFISQPRLQVASVSGRTVAYTLDFIEATKGSYNLYWERTGRWALAHGSSGWMLDSDVWTANHLVAIDNPQTKQRVPIQDTVHPDGRHDFTFSGFEYSYLAKGNSWSITLVATPQPAADTEGYPESAPTEPGQSAELVPPPIQYPGGYVAPPAADNNCEEASVEGVYDDGKILALDDGRHLRVQDYDTPTSSVWVAPLDGMICGDRFVDKDDNEGVDLEY